MRNSSVIGRVAAVAAVVVALVAVAIIVLSSGSTYQVRAVFANASQIVSGRPGGGVGHERSGRSPTSP